jgi:hypothetical protein
MKRSCCVLLLAVIVLDFEAASKSLRAQDGPPVNQFLNTWLVDRNVGGATEYFDLVAVRRALSLQIDDAQMSNWIRRALTMWLISDHGLVSRWGHGDPNAPDWPRLPLTVDGIEGERAQFGSVPEAIRSPVNGDRPYELTATPNQILPGYQGQAQTAAFVFRRIPTDLVLVTFGRTGGPWRIVSFVWIVS